MTALLTTAATSGISAGGPHDGRALPHGAVVDADPGSLVVRPGPPRVHWLSDWTRAFMDRRVDNCGALQLERSHAPLVRERRRTRAVQLIMRAPDGVGAPTGALTAPLLIQEYGVEIFIRSTSGTSPPPRPPQAPHVVGAIAPTPPSPIRVAARFVAAAIATRGNLRAAGVPVAGGWRPRLNGLTSPHSTPRPARRRMADGAPRPTSRAAPRGTWRGTSRWRAGVVLAVGESL